MKINDAKSFGQAVREQRKERGYTQAFVSEHTGYSASFLSDLENGKATCEIGKAIRIANLLGMDVELNKRG